MTATDFKWYHEIDLGNGEITVPLDDYRATWEVIRKTRQHLDYKNKRVFDVASWDGMWAFEAERLGASEVYALDINPRQGSREDIATAFDKFAYARQQLNSRVVAYYDRSIHSLTDLLPITGPADIVQCLGLFYHLENPWHALKQCRSVLRPGGWLLLETAYDISSGCHMRINRGHGLFYGDVTTYWAPTQSCLLEMLSACCFKVELATINCLNSHPPHGVDRLCLAAQALNFDDVDTALLNEFNNNYRTSI